MYGAWLAEGEEFGGALGGDHGGEGPERLAELHGGVEPLDDAGLQRGGEDRAVAQGARSGFDPSLEESGDHAVGELVGEELGGLDAEGLLAEAGPGGQVEGLVLI